MSLKIIPDVLFYIRMEEVLSVWTNSGPASRSCRTYLFGDYQIRAPLQISLICLIVSCAVYYYLNNKILFNIAAHDIAHFMWIIAWNLICVCKSCQRIGNCAFSISCEIWSKILRKQWIIVELLQNIHKDSELIILAMLRMLRHAI